MSTSASLRWSDRMAALAAALAAIASAAGLFVTDLYRDNEAMIAQARGTDLATLFVAVPAIAIGLGAARAGSVRGRLVALGAVGYLVYSYAIYSFQVVISPMTPLHIAILGLAAWSLILGGVALAGMDLDTVGSRLPRRTAGGFLILIVVLFAGLWLAQIIGAITSGVLPVAVSDLELPTSAVYALDLAFALPMLAVGAATPAAAPSERRRLGGRVPDLRRADGPQHPGAVRRPGKRGSDGRPIDDDRLRSRRRHRRAPGGCRPASLSCDTGRRSSRDRAALTLTEDPHEAPPGDGRGARDGWTVEPGANGTERARGPSVGSVHG